MLQVYTGNGKGKTTAAMGLAIRALGAGRKVYIMQFMKSLAYSEQKVLQGFAPKLTLRTSGKPFFIAEEGTLSKALRDKLGDNVVIFPKGKPPQDYMELINTGFAEVRSAVSSQEYGLVILDELNVALHFGLIDREVVEELLDVVPEDTEMVLTGRDAPDWLIERADLVTDMQEVKHYYTRGVEARKGIEC
ncbi:MAG: cob(I)yrinic acid a,c-diamide adenosyltransferase [Selenomonas sp.]|uniref:cob(I)yrinic acid a,c-diamide adenosyltransferase n=1 Tax=Selenomonas sp. TaxID=2053611 RepID=UPI0025EAE193|nr:cob(I)yrinic acid a,c-diamide adenosyltransferase [Selenomonas sp.]MCR5756817.1 cob(I)yrinic acid a,c-diamide adenosyltransferase [Selenomonas sp.]